VVVVLGPTGRNFAAGMSGGIAYVLDEAGDFKIRCNLSMVELEPIVEEDSASVQSDDMMRDMMRHDALRLKTLIEKHLHYTNSSRARLILDNWGEYLPRFVKVMPVDYRRALMQKEPS